MRLFIGILLCSLTGSWRRYTVSRVLSTPPAKKVKQARVNMWAVFFLVVTALYTGGQLARKLTRRPFFVEGCLRALSREACFREMLSRTLLFSTSWNESCHIFMATSFASLAHLPLHGHIFPFMGTSSPSWPHIPLHGHIFHFIGTSSSSLAHLPLHRHIFPFIGTSSPSSAHLPLHGYIFLLRTGGVGRWQDMVCFRESFREAFAGIREGPWEKNAQSDSCRTCIL